MMEQPDQNHLCRLDCVEIFRIAASCMQMHRWVRTPPPEHIDGPRIHVKPVVLGEAIKISQCIAHPAANVEHGIALVDRQKAIRLSEIQSAKHERSQELEHPGQGEESLKRGPYHDLVR